MFLHIPLAEKRLDPRSSGMIESLVPLTNVLEEMILY